MTADLWGLLHGGSAHWLVVPVMAPLVVALLLFLSGRRGAPWLLPPLLVLLLLSFAILGVQLAAAGPLRYAVGGWGAPLGIDLYLDGLSYLLLGLTIIVGVLVSLYGGKYFAATDKGAGAQADAFWPLWLLLWSGMNALYLSADIFNLYVTLEMLTLAAVPLVALAGSAKALAGGLRYLAWALLASMVYLLGVALLYTAYGTLDIALLGDLLQPEPLTWLALALLMISLLTKTALFPLHFWLPPAHSSAPAPVSALLSALVVKTTFYLLLRLGYELLPGPLNPASAQLLGALGALAIVYGSLAALRQTRLKMLVAYSTVAQLGYLLLLFPLALTGFAALAWDGVVLHALSHGLAKAALFLAAGNVLLSLGHDRIAALGRASDRLVITFFTIGLAGVAIMGLPPSGGFLGKWQLAQAAAASGQWWWLLVVVAGGLLAAGYIFRVLSYAFVQPADQPAGTGGAKALPRVLELAPLALALMAVAMGLMGTPLLELLAIGSPFGPAADIGVSPEVSP